MQISLLAHALAKHWAYGRYVAAHLGQWDMWSLAKENQPQIGHSKVNSPRPLPSYTVFRIHRPRKGSYQCPHHALCSVTQNFYMEVSGIHCEISASHSNTTKTPPSIMISSVCTQWTLLLLCDLYITWLYNFMVDFNNFSFIKWNQLIWGNGFSSKTGTYSSYCLLISALLYTVISDYYYNKLPKHPV